jgi:GcrA cell cycle regulator
MSRHPISRPWTSDQVARLEMLIASGASAVRTAAALKRPITSVRVKARELGKSFPTLNETRKKICTGPQPRNALRPC